jgi:SAM-dependent methyltransferase
LDLGAGEFFDVACLKYLGWKVKGVDKKTGIDLEKPLLFRQRPFNLVYSNYVYHFIKNKPVFVQTVLDNLKPNGWMFLLIVSDKKEDNGIR